MSKPLSLANRFSGLWHAIYLHVKGAQASIPPDLLHTLMGIAEALMAGLYDVGAQECGGVNTPAFAAFVQAIDSRLGNIVPCNTGAMLWKIFSRGIFGLKFLTAAEVLMLIQQLLIVIGEDTAVICDADRRGAVLRAFQLMGELVTVLHRKRRFTSADIAALQQLISNFQAAAHAAYEGVPYADGERRTQRAKARVGASAAASASRIPANFGAAAKERWGFPKFHALVHIPEFIRRFGAPRGFNGTTYESLMKLLKEWGFGAGHGGGGAGHIGNVCIKAALRSVGAHLLRQTQEARDAGVDVIYAAPGDARAAGLLAAVAGVEDGAEDDAGGSSAALAAAAVTATVCDLWRAYFESTAPFLQALNHSACLAAYASSADLPAIAAAEALVAEARLAGDDLVYLPAAAGAGGIEVSSAFLVQPAAAVPSDVSFTLRKPRSAAPVCFPPPTAAAFTNVDARLMGLIAGLLRLSYAQALMPTALQGNGCALLTGLTLRDHFSVTACHSAQCVRVLQGPPVPPGTAPRCWRASAAPTPRRSSRCTMWPRRWRTR